MTAPPPHVEGRLPGTGKGKGYHFLLYHRILVEALHLFMTMGGESAASRLCPCPSSLPTLTHSQDLMRDASSFCQDARFAPTRTYLVFGTQVLVGNLR